MNRDLLYKTLAMLVLATATGVYNIALWYIGLNYGVFGILFLVGNYLCGLLSTLLVSAYHLKLRKVKRGEEFNGLRATAKGFFESFLVNVPNCGIYFLSGYFSLVISLETFKKKMEDIG